MIRISESHGKAQNPRGKMILGQFSSYVIVKGYFHTFTKKLIRTDLSPYHRYKLGSSTSITDLADPL